MMRYMDSANNWVQGIIYSFSSVWNQIEILRCLGVVPSVEYSKQMRVLFWSITLRFIGVQGSNTVFYCCFFFLLFSSESCFCIHSADGTVSTSFHFKPELIRINLFLIKLLAFLIAETCRHLTLKPSFPIRFHFLQHPGTLFSLWNN